jgi:hypothetical protein
VAAALPHHNPPRPLQGPNHYLVVQARDLGHTAISTTSAFGFAWESSSTGSR